MCRRLCASLVLVPQCSRPGIWNIFNKVVDRWEAKRGWWEWDRFLMEHGKRTFSQELLGQLRVDDCFGTHASFWNSTFQSKRSWPPGVSECSMRLTYYNVTFHHPVDVPEPGDVSKSLTCLWTSPLQHFCSKLGNCRFFSAVSDQDGWVCCMCFSTEERQEKDQHMDLRCINIYISYNWHILFINWYNWTHIVQ